MNSINYINVGFSLLPISIHYKLQPKCDTANSKDIIADMYENNVLHLTSVLIHMNVQLQMYCVYFFLYLKKCIQLINIKTIKIRHSHVFAKLQWDSF